MATEEGVAVEEETAPPVDPKTTPKPKPPTVSGLTCAIIGITLAVGIFGFAHIDWSYDRVPEVTTIDFTE